MTTILTVICSLVFAVDIAIANPEPSPSPMGKHMILHVPYFIRHIYHLRPRAQHHDVARGPSQQISASTKHKVTVSPNSGKCEKLCKCVPTFVYVPQPTNCLQGYSHWSKAQNPHKEPNAYKYAHAYSSYDTANDLHNSNKYKLNQLYDDVNNMSDWTPIIPLHTLKDTPSHNYSMSYLLSRKGFQKSILLSEKSDDNMSAEPENVFLENAAKKYRKHGWELVGITKRMDGAAMVVFQKKSGTSSEEEDSASDRKVRNAGSLDIKADAEDSKSTEDGSSHTTERGASLTTAAPVEQSKGRK